ncbi:MAG TPA: alpha/beta hydrolase [Bacteroidia bacterium]|jgi:pimeloyl-ACP methyl ester carboxylesterase|nr:alpha/beta hydrolase [Bacteroidia bacterium]
MIHYTTFRKAKIRYSDEGKGRALVLVHGFPLNLQVWKEFSAELAKHFRVIAIDLPGFGESENIGYVHSMELMAQCVKEVMDNLGLRRYILVGHSMGGYAGLAFGELFPDNLRGFVMFHSSSYKDSDEKKIDRERSIETIKKKRKSYLKIFTGNMFATPTPLLEGEGRVRSFGVKELKECLKKVQEIANTASARALVAATEGMKNRKDREIILRFAQYPVLFIFGKKDKIFKLENVLPQAETPADKEVLILENAGHMGFYEAKEETLNAIIKFANRCFRMKVE